MIFVNDIKRWISQSETFYADKVPLIINKQMHYLIEKFCVKIFMTVTKQKLKYLYFLLPISNPSIHFIVNPHKPKYDISVRVYMVL